jgi:cellulose synthase/poly-beta-1,6-N-acetylglucosamine synthase-like glycosyltransferase
MDKMLFLKIILIIPNAYIILNLIIFILFKFNDLYKHKTEFKLYSHPTVSILIPAHNEESVIENTVKSFLNIKYCNSYEIIVIAHNCNDNTAINANIDNRIKVIEYNYGNTKGDALNYGIKFASGDIICVCDADAEVKKDFLTKSMQVMSNKNLDGLQIQVRSKNKGFMADMTDIEFIIHGKLKQYLFSKGSFSILGGCGQFIKRKYLDDIGYWSNSLADDTELSIRLLEHGCKIGYTDKVEIYQEAVLNLKDYLTQRARWCHGNTSLLTKIWRLNLLQSTNIFFQFNGILFSPFIKLSNIIFILNIFLGLFNFKVWLILPYFLLITIGCIMSKRNPLYFIPYYIYSQLTYIIYAKTIVRFIKNDSSWNKTKRIKECKV